MLTLLERLRLDARLTREQLAAETKVPVRTIRALEGREVRRPTLKTLEPLADRFEVAPSALMADLVSGGHPDPDLPAAA